MSVDRFNILYHKYVADSLTVEEWHEWRQMFAEDAFADELEKLLAQTTERNFVLRAGDFGDRQAMFEAIVNHEDRTIRKTGLVRALNTRWVKYAAVFLLLLSGIAAYWQYSSVDNSVVGRTVLPDQQWSSKPEGPVLILANGRIISLDSTGNGLIATEAGTSINKTADGTISYVATDSPADSVFMNTMSTPKGRQYRVTLPDGSKVWLNALTSIRFPAAFTATQRLVELEGEAYFEIVPDKSRPFLVRLAKEKSIEVLGTAFNANNYADEPYYTTTLISGSVKVVSPENEMVLKGSETVSIASSCRIMPGVNSQDQLAWKNGVFNLRGTDTRALLRQIARWYDIEIEYKTDAPKKEFEGKIGRDLSLSQMRKVLNDFGIHNSLNGNKLIIEK